MLLFYIRHGDPVYDPDGLTELGRRQAEACARRLSAYGLDKIYSSSSERARLTALPTCEILKKDMTLLDWCQESLAWQEFTVVRGGHRQWIFQAEDTVKLLTSLAVTRLGEDWTEHPDFSSTGAKKGIERVRRHTWEFLSELGYAYDTVSGMYLHTGPSPKRVALFAHQGFGMAFLSTVLCIPYPIFSTRFDTGHTGITVIDFPEVDGPCLPRCLQMANDSHLYADRLPTNYQNKVLF
ncbi:MAG: histidine phosphatase family protein [Clostridiales bacterium]|nr:histidine phosphatase family protein [Clostridiales bacterium]